MVEPVRGVRSVVYWSLAAFFFALAMVGVILPGIPTTPFLLLMCYFLLRVSPTLHARALAWPVVSGPLRDWQDQGGVRSSVKVLAITMVTLLIGTTIVFTSLGATFKAAIVVAAAYGISVVIRLPSAQVFSD